MTHLPSGGILDYSLDFPSTPMAEQSWTTMAAPRVRDAFAGAPEHPSYEQLRHEIRIKSKRVDALVAMTKLLETQLRAEKQLAKVARMEAERRRAVAAAQTVFVLQHWNKHPDWTSADAHLAMQQHVQEFPF